MLWNDIKIGMRIPAQELKLHWSTRQDPSIRVHWRLLPEDAVVLSIDTDSLEFDRPGYTGVIHTKLQKKN